MEWSGRGWPDTERQTVQRNRKDQQEIRSQYAVYGVPVPEGNTAPQHLKPARFPPHSPVRLEFPLRPAKTSAIRRALVRSPHESGCTASSRICSCSGARNRAKPTCRMFSTKTGELSSRRSTLCKDSRGLFRSDAGDFLSISSATSGCGIRHIGPSFPATWVVPGCAATRAARVVDGTL